MLAPLGFINNPEGPDIVQFGILAPTTTPYVVFQPQFHKSNVSESGPPGQGVPLACMAADIAFIKSPDATITTTCQSTWSYFWCVAKYPDTAFIPTALPTIQKYRMSHLRTLHTLGSGVGLSRPSTAFAPLVSTTSCGSWQAHNLLSVSCLIIVTILH